MPIKKFMSDVLNAVNTSRPPSTEGDIVTLDSMAVMLRHALTDVKAFCTKEDMLSCSANHKKAVMCFLSMVSQIAEILNPLSYLEQDSFWLGTDINVGTSSRIFKQKVLYLICVRSGPSLKRISDLSLSTLYMSGTLDHVLDSKHLGLDHNATLVNTDNLMDRSHQLAIHIINNTVRNGAWKFLQEAETAKIYANAISMCLYYLRMFVC